MAAGNKTGGLLEWVVCTVLISLIGLIGIGAAVSSFMTAVFMPIPVMFLVLRLDARYALLGLLAACLFMFMDGMALLQVLDIGICYGLLGLGCGMLLKNQVSPGKTLAAVVVAAIVLSAASLALYYALTGIDPLVLPEEERLALKQSLVITNEQMQSFENILPAGEADFYKYVVELWEFYLPGQFIVIAAFNAVVMYLLAVLILRRWNFSYPLPVFPTLYLPWYSIWGLIIGFGFILLGDWVSPQLAKVGKNILLVLITLGCVMGLSVAVFYYRKIKLALPLKLIFLFLAVSYLPISLTVLFVLGTTDPLLNYRRLPELK